MKAKSYLLSLLTLFAICFYEPSYCQDKVIVLVNGHPPLTQLMVGKTIVLLEWALDLKLSKDQAKAASALYPHRMDYGWKETIAAIKANQPFHLLQTENLLMAASFAFLEPSAGTMAQLLWLMAWVGRAPALLTKTHWN